MSDLFATPEKIAAQTAAYTAVKESRFTPTSLIEYQSTGRVLIIADSATSARLGALPEPLSSEILALEGEADQAVISIEGALGAFEVQVGKRLIKADILLDCSPQPILDMPLKPPGYLHVQQGDDLAIVKETLAGLVGVFEKPKYYHYDASICAHGRSGNVGCTRCIDACPALAIRSLGEAVEVDAQRCHGGGICATVCPSGAMRYAYPVSEELLDHLRSMIFAYLKEGVGAPDIAFVSEEEQTRVQHAMPGALIISVEEVASVGPEIWLSALAWGARSVQLFDLEEMPPSSRQALSLNIEMVGEMLAAMRYPSGAVSLISDLNELLSIKVMPAINTATHAALDQKRQAFYMALDHLAEQAEKVKPMISLPTGAIFGEASVIADACTLCMACVSACPGNALQDGGETPQLGFLEANCLQCGVCTATCPEDAITISPRILLDRAARNKTRVLYEESPFYCISCGKAFATTSGITTIISKLAGHAMFTDERARSRLKMCGDCRVKDMMVDPNSEL